MLGLWDTWTTLHEQYGGILQYYYSFYLCFNAGHHLL